MVFQSFVFDCNWWVYSRNAPWLDNLIKIRSTHLLPIFYRFIFLIAACVWFNNSPLKGRVRGQHECIKTDQSAIFLQTHEENWQAHAFSNAPDRLRMVKQIKYLRPCLSLEEWNSKNIQSTTSDTPKKKYIRNNICVICGLSFIQTEITPEVN